jgi:hypothetical protein
VEEKGRRGFFGWRCPTRNCLLFLSLDCLHVLTNGTTCVCLQETDKATIDVEAQEDGIMGKIIVSALSTLLVFVIF